MPSSVIRAWSYDAEARRLAVTFMSGDVYAYLDVPASVAEDLASASSKGRCFAARIRDRYPFARVWIASP